MPRQRANGVSATSAKVERAEKVGSAVGRAWVVGGAVHVGQYYQRMSTLFYCDTCPEGANSAHPACYDNPVQAALRRTVPLQSPLATAHDLMSIV
jgi:hypothetical protein